MDVGIFVNDEIWVDDPSHPDPGATEDPVAVEQHHLEPPAGGSVCRIFRFEPESAEPAAIDEAAAAAASRFDTGDAMEADN